MILHVKHGKGGKDRFVPLPKGTLLMLRDFWKTHRNNVWLFPAPGRSGTHMPESNRPLPISSVQIVFKAAVRECGIHKNVSVHTLRHSYATHLLEAGVNLRLLQSYLGHSQLNCTALYTHLTRKIEVQALETINKLMENLAW